MSSAFKKIMIFLFILLAGVFAYGAVSKTEAQSEPLLSSSATGGAVVIPGSTETDGSDERIKNVVTLLSSLQGVKLDTKFFSSQEFTSLEDLSTPLPSATNVGRPNPFAPIGVDVGTIPGTSDQQSVTPVNDALNAGLPIDTTAPPDQNAATSTSVTTNPATAIARTSAILHATLLAGTTATTLSFAYGTTSATLLHVSGVAGADSTFSATLTGLAPNTTYYAKATMQVAGITFSGNTVTFKTAQ